TLEILTGVDPQQANPARKATNWAIINNYLSLALVSVILFGLSDGIIEDTGQLPVPTGYNLVT
ncbi:MAG: hypothetical protein ACI8R4_002985, partial [Paracoccaceae bacterium]